MNTASDYSVEAIEQAEARRQRVFRRMMFGAVFFIDLLMLIHLWWGGEAGRRLQAEIDRCHAAGEPILVSDFPSPPTIPDEENAAYYYRQAVLAIKPTDNPALTWNDTVYGTRSAWKTYARDIMASVKANETALALIRKGRACSRTDWGFRYQSPLINANLPPLNLSSDASRLTALAARAYHAEGDHAEVFELLIDSESIVRNTARQERSCLLLHLLRIDSASYVVETIEDLMPTIVTDDAQAARSLPQRAAPRRQAEQLIRLLLDDEIMRNSWRYGVYGERALMLDCAQLFAKGDANFYKPRGISSGTVDEQVVGRLAQPIIELDAARETRHRSQLLAAGSASDFVVARRLYPPEDESKPVSKTWSCAHPFTRFRYFGDTLVMHFRMLALRRMAATAIAIRLHELDHGRRPASLEELVPGYLPAVPEDPFAEGGRKLGYRPDASSPVLYSVNMDGRDDQGENELGPKGGVLREEKDLVFSLVDEQPLGAPPPRRSESTSSKAEDN